MYVLFFIKLASRRVFLVGCTELPTAGWVTQQARHLSWQLGQANLRPKLLIHDRDSKFVAGLDEVFRSEAVRVATTPYRARRARTPSANAGSDPYVVRPWTGCDRRRTPPLAGPERVR